MDDATANVIALLSFSDQVPVFSDGKVSIKTKSFKVEWMPYGLVQKASINSWEKISKDDYVNIQKKLWSSYKLNEKFFNTQYSKFGFTILEIQGIYSNAAVETAFYFISRYNDFKNGKVYFDKA